MGEALLLLTIPIPEEDALQLEGDVGDGLVAEIGDLKQVAREVVAIKPHERVRVEHDRVHARDKHEVERDAAGEAIGQENEEMSGDGRNNQLGKDTGERDVHLVPQLAHHPRIGRVDVAAGREEHETYAHLMHLASESATRGGVPEFVQRLGNDDGDVEQPKVGRREKVGDASGELIEIGHDQPDAPEHEGDRPADEPRGPDEVHRSDQATQPRTGINDGDLEKQQLADDRSPEGNQPLGLGTAGVFHEPPGILVQQPSRRELVDEHGQLLERARAVGIAGREPSLSLQQGPLPVQLTDDVRLLRLETEIRQRQRILQDVVLLVLERLPTDDDVHAQPRRNDPGEFRVARGKLGSFRRRAWQHSFHAWDYSATAPPMACSICATVTLYRKTASR